MKGKLVPIDQTSYLYTDINDQDWSLMLDLAQGMVVVARVHSDPNMYGKDTSSVLVRSDTFVHAGEGVDGWVDDWNAGQNPGPRLTVNQTTGNSLWPLLLLAALVLLSDKRR